MILLMKTAAGFVVGLMQTFRDCDAENGPENTSTVGVAKRLSQTFREESTRLRTEASKMLWSDSARKDTSLTLLKVFGCDSFVKVKDICEEAMKCTFISSGSDEMRYSFQDMKSHQLNEANTEESVVLVDIPENLAENDNIVLEHGLSSEITQSLGGSSDLSEGSENSRSFEDGERSDDEDSEDEAFSKEGGSETL
ncbi:hypothetical protein Tco_0335430 [Tanacetum coccineum]